MILSDTFFCTLFSFLFCGNCTLFSGAICGRRLMCCLHRTCSARCGCSFCFLFVSETISVNETIGLLAKEEPVCWQLHACMDLAMSEVFYTSHVFGRGQICLAPEDIFDVLLCCLQNLASSKIFFTNPSMILKLQYAMKANFEYVHMKEFYKTGTVPLTLLYHCINRIFKVDPSSPAPGWEKKLAKHF